MSKYRSACRWFCLSICYNFCTKRLKAEPRSLCGTGTAWTLRARQAPDHNGFFRTRRLFWFAHKGQLHQPDACQFLRWLHQWLHCIRRHSLLSLVSAWHLLMSALVAVRLLQHSWVWVWWPWRECAVPKTSIDGYYVSARAWATWLSAPKEYWMMRRDKTTCRSWLLFRCWRSRGRSCRCEFLAHAMMLRDHGAWDLHTTCNGCVAHHRNWWPEQWAFMHACVWQFELHAQADLALLYLAKYFIHQPNQVFHVTMLAEYQLSWIQSIHGKDMDDNVKCFRQAVLKLDHIKRKQGEGSACVFDGRFGCFELRCEFFTAKSCIDSLFLVYLCD